MATRIYSRFRRGPRTTMDKVETIALNRGHRLSYKDKKHEYLSYDCKTVYWSGTDIEELYTFMLGMGDYSRGEICPTHWPVRAQGWEAAKKASGG